jgi:hypothetical protein
LDSEAQQVPANGYSEAVIKLLPGSLVVGFLFGNEYTNNSGYQFNIQITDLELDHEFFSEPVSQSFLANQQGMATLGVDNVNYPNLLSSPYPVTGKGRFLFQIWNQTDAVLSVIPLILTSEPTLEP